MNKQMKKLPKIIFAVFLSILLCIPAALAVFHYTQPMKDVSYDFSMMPEDGQDSVGNNGWSVYTYENGIKTELTADGAGGYSGLSYPGQTFYFSRELTEELDSPTLRIGTVNRTVSVFLDGNMIYTDCPELDNRIGFLTLPMLAFDRSEAVMISLPPDYIGQTLTIAQSSPTLSETQDTDITVYPCNVTLYCGYAYESSLIASSAETMLPSVLLFSLGIFLLVAFIWNAFRGDIIIQLPVFALTVFLQMCSILSKADFFYQYFGKPTTDPVWLCFFLSVGTLLLFIALYARQLRPLFLASAIIQWLSIILYIITQVNLEYGDLYVFFMDLPKVTGFFTLLATLVGSFLLWKKGNSFFRHLARAALVLIIVYALFLIISIPLYPDYFTSVCSRIGDEFELLTPNFSLKLLWNLCLISSLTAVIAELFEQEAARRTELAVLSAKNELAVQSYENLRLQSEEVMMLRHDTMKHYSLLRTMANDAPDRIAGYLDELIGQFESVRPVVSGRNQILNILLNGKLNAASAKGISTEIIRSDAPEKLPLTDTELCCLVANILDNAINAASAPETVNPYIKLDFHCKDRHFVFTCKNSMPEYYGSKEATSPEHGYGLKIIRQIMSRFGNNILIEQTETAYKITIVIPLPS